MIAHYYSSTGARPLEKIKHLKIIDIGGAESFADGYLDTIVDAWEPKAKCNRAFIGNINDPELWASVRAHGKWDYAICTHTLEDIINPIYVARQIEQIAHAGLIIVPSKYRELARFAGSYRGFLHHRWIFDVVDGVLTAFPKIGWIEQDRFDKVHEELPGREELIIEWEGSIGLQALNNDQPYRDDKHIIELYDQLLR